MVYFTLLSNYKDLLNHFSEIFYITYQPLFIFGASWSITGVTVEVFLLFSPITLLHGRSTIATSQRRFWLYHYSL